MPEFKQFAVDYWLSDTPFGDPDHTDFSDDLEALIRCAPAQKHFDLRPFGSHKFYERLAASPERRRLESEIWRVIDPKKRRTITASFLKYIRHPREGGDPYRRRYLRMDGFPPSRE